MLRTICMILVLVLGLLLVSGCKSPEAMAGSANQQTHQQTDKLAAQVNSAQAALTNSDRAVTDVANDPRLPADLKAKLTAVHQSNTQAQAALKPIGTDIIPAINHAADQALQAEISAQNEQNRRTGYAIALLVFAFCLYGFKTDLGTGWAVSAILAGVSALIVGVIVAQISRYIPWLVGIGVIGLVGYLIEAAIKGGWFSGGFAAALHDVWNTVESETKTVVGDAESLGKSVAAKVEGASPAASASAALPSPAPAASKAP